MEPGPSLQRRDLLRHSMARGHQGSQHPQRNDDNYDGKLHITMLLVESLAGKKVQFVRAKRNRFPETAHLCLKMEVKRT